MHNALHIWACANKYLYTFKHIYFLTESTHVLRLSRETKSAIFNYLQFFFLFLIFELSPKVIWGCRHIVKYQRKSESVGGRIMVISYTNCFLTGRKISHGKEYHWFCCAQQRRRKGSLHTLGMILTYDRRGGHGLMPSSLTSTKDPCRTLDRYKSLFDDAQEELPWPARRHQTLKKICKQPTSTGKGARHH